MLNGSSAEFEQDMPFGVWVDALDAYVAAQDPSEAGGWDPRLLAELGGVLPSVAGANGDHGVADERYRVHRAMRSLLERLSEAKPLVLVFDDLHWSDTASLELIAALLRRGPDSPVLFALAFRPGQAPERLSAALAVPALQRIELSQLSEADAAAMLAGVDAATMAHIYRQGGGNPFYLEQLARASDAGRLPAASPRRRASRRSRDAGVPAAVSALLAGEIESLPEATRAMLNGAAVAGEPFEPDLAAAAAELSEAEGLTALDDLLELDLVRPTQVPRRFVFRHPLVRQAVYESTRGGWRLAAHARAAEALAARGAAAGERAHHVEQSATAGDEAAIAVLMEAGDAAAARAPGAAARWCEAALRLLPGADAARQVDLKVALASALRSLGDLERCRSTLLEAVDLLPADDAARRVELTALCAAVEHWQGRHEDAHRRLVKAWDELPDRSTEAAAALLIELAVDGLYELDYDQALEMGGAALDTARSVGDPALIAAAASALCLGETVAGRIDEARVHHEEALAVDGLSDDELAPRLEALYYLGWAENYLERYDEAIAHVDRGIGIARATGRGAPAGADDAGEGLPAGDSGPAGGGARGVRAGGGVRPAVGQPPLPVLGAVRARLGPLLPGRPACRRGRARGEQPGGRTPRRRHHAGRQRRPGLAARGHAVRAGRGGAGLRGAPVDRWGRARPRDPGGELLLLGDPRPGRAEARAAGRGRGASWPVPTTTWPRSG